MGPLFSRSGAKATPLAYSVRLRAAGGDNLQRFVSVIGLDELSGLGDLAGAN